MLKNVFDFFEKNIRVNRPLLLGLSGGPDSTCLLHLLLLWNKAPIHIVHVDHGWRTESQAELESLKALAGQLQLPFHATRLDPSNYKANKEAESRRERYAFFFKVAKEVDAQGIVLGHQQDDQSETVFKRLLEGASLQALSGIQPIRDIEGLCVLRPLLSLSKKEITQWLDKQGVSYFLDPTNLQTKYLRGVLRTEIFPFLRKKFGKEFEQSLCSIGEEAQELKAYLDMQVAPYREKALHGPWGLYFADLPQSTCLLKALIRSSLATLSRQQLQLAVKLLIEKTANKQLMTKEGSLFIDRGRAFFCDTHIQDIEGNIAIKEGSCSFGNWEITATITSKCEEPKNTLINAWQGNLSTYLPVGEYSLSAGSPKMRRKGKEYKNYLTEMKIPHFIVSKVPVLCVGNEIVEDFLTGANIHKKSESYLYVTLKFRDSWQKTCKIST